MVKVFTFATALLSSMTAFGVTHLKGEVIINSKKVSLTATYNTVDRDSFIKLGNKQFSVVDYGPTQLSGKRIVQENNKVLVDEDIMIQIDPDSLTKDELKQLVPSAKCKNSDNLIVMLGDNIKGDVTGGCGEIKN